MTDLAVHTSYSAGPPKLVAHRGYPRRFPGNTLESIEAALEVGACFVEFDVQLTSDRVPVLLHDEKLRRSVGVRGLVTRKTLAQLAAIELEPGIGIPPLDAAIDLIRNWPTAQAFIEIKGASLRRFGVDPVLERVLECMRDATSQCIVISFDADCVVRARELGVPRIGWIVETWNGQSRQRAEAVQPDYLFCNHRKLPRGPEPLWPGPWSWVLYEIDSPELALRLAARGADLIETMAIGELLQHPELAEGSCLGEGTSTSSRDAAHEPPLDADIKRDCPPRPTIG